MINGMSEMEPMIWGMGFAGLLGIVIVLLTIAALIKYLRN